MKKVFIGVLVFFALVYGMYKCNRGISKPKTHA